MRRATFCIAQDGKAFAATAIANDDDALRRPQQERSRRGASAAAVFHGKSAAKEARGGHESSGTSQDDGRCTRSIQCVSPTRRAPYEISLQC